MAKHHCCPIGWACHSIHTWHVGLQRGLHLCSEQPQLHHTTAVDVICRISQSLAAVAARKCIYETGQGRVQLLQARAWNSRPRHTEAVCQTGKWKKQASPAPGLLYAANSHVMARLRAARSRSALP